MNFLKSWIVAAALALCCCGTQLWAGPFSVSYLDGGTWNTVYVQGFSPSVSPNPNPGSAAGDTVYLNQFQFFKSGNADTAANIRLAIINNIFGDLTGLSTSSSLFVGLSSNTIASTAPIATGDPITFNFSSLALDVRQQLRRRVCQCWRGRRIDAHACLCAHCELRRNAPRLGKFPSRNELWNRIAIRLCDE